MIQEFLVNGEAIPAARPRSSLAKNSNKLIVYKPKDDVDWQERIARQVRSHKNYCFSRNTAVKFVFFAFYTKPIRSAYNEPISHSIGDLDNISKNLQDALQSRAIKIGRLKVKQKGLLFEDDSQIVRLVCQKFYTKENPFVIIRVTDEIDNKECEWL